MMALEQRKVKEIVQNSVSHAVDIPEFQRQFVWDPEQVKLLAESLYRDYPVGFFLLWNASDYVESRTVKGNESPYWIVDGQQRTTALAILLGQKPYWWSDHQDWNKRLERYDVMVNVMPTRGVPYLEFALPNPVRRQNPRWTSLRKILGMAEVERLTVLAQEVVNRTTESDLERAMLFPHVHGAMQRLWQIRERDIPILKISHEAEDVAEIFTRLNRAGTRVKEADTILALAAVANPGWVREDYMPFDAGLEESGWDLDPGIYIRSLTGIALGRARLREIAKPFWSADSLPPAWRRTKDAIAEVLKRLSDHGISSSALLPSANSVIPLVVLHHRWGGERGYRFGKALWWFLLANWDGRYSGSAISSLDEDVRTIKDAADFENAIQSLVRRLAVKRELAAEDFLGRYDRMGNQFLRLMLYLVLFANDAVDWVTHTRVGYDKTASSLLGGYAPQWHHIFSRRVLKTRGCSVDEINALGNITVLNERTNVTRLSGKSPARYIRDLDISPAVLRHHLIPERFVAVVADHRQDMEQVWSVESYGAFVQQRATLLAQAANGQLAALREAV